MIDPVIGIFVAVAAVYGLIVGSFLNVVICRVPSDESVVSPRSRCPECRRTLTWRENIPVLSWLKQKGRCAGCDTRISAQYPLVEAGTAVAWACVVASFGVTWMTLVLLAFASVSIALCVIDVQHLRLPDPIVKPSIPFFGAVIPLATWADGSLIWWQAWLGGVAYAGVLQVMAMAKPGAMGGGDVKVALILGMFLAWSHPLAVLIGFFASSFVGAFWALGLLVFSGRAAARKFAFGPSLIISTWLVMVWGGPLVTWYAGLLGL